MKATLFDTDMHIHRLGIDRPVRENAKIEFSNNRPSAMSEFTIVEFKGNYIACLILLRRKISDSDSLESAFSRIQNSGGRKAILMAVQFIKCLGGENFPLKPWSTAQNIMLTYLDSQIEIVWQNFFGSVDKVIREIGCTRAKEEPQDNNGKWSATIPKCKRNNTNCKIYKFFLSYLYELENLSKEISKLSDDLKTKEILKIHEITKKLIEKRKFNWQGSVCRQIGDLIIGLESITGKALVSSNFKEHSVLSKSLGYTFKYFDHVKIRSK